MNVKQFVAIASVVFAFMGTVCHVVGQGADVVDQIKNLKGGKK